MKTLLKSFSSTVSGISAAILFTTSLSLSLSAQAAEVTLKTKEGFKLKVDYYQSKISSNRAVLMLHQCNYNRTMYNQIGEQLAQQGIHALSLDFRGFGESINKAFNVEKLQALPREERRKAWRAMSKSWPKDVQLAHDYLKGKAADHAIVGVIGASCGGSQAITLAENNKVTAISFFSSGQNEENIARYKNSLADKPTMIIAAQGDTGTYNSGKKLFELANNNDSKFIVYKGDDHGYPLLDKDKNLAIHIVSWFDGVLTN